MCVLRHIIIRLCDSSRQSHAHVNHCLRPRHSLTTHTQQSSAAHCLPALNCGGCVSQSVTYGVPGGYLYRTSLTDIFQPNLTDMCDIPVWSGAFRECGRHLRCSHTHAVHEKTSCTHRSFFEHLGVLHRHTRARRKNVPEIAPAPS